MLVLTPPGMSGRDKIVPRTLFLYQSSRYLPVAISTRTTRVDDAFIGFRRELAQRSRTVCRYLAIASSARSQCTKAGVSRCDSASVLEVGRRSGNDCRL